MRKSSESAGLQAGQELRFAVLILRADMMKDTHIKAGFKDRAFRLPFHAGNCKVIQQSF
jgi:hypothetical protein